jgi:serine/threonine protein kinase
MLFKTEKIYILLWIFFQEVMFVITFANIGDSLKNKPVYFLLFLTLLGFFIACLVAGLEYIHNKNIIHRILYLMMMVKIFLYIIFLHQIGYLRITDFGIARLWRPDNA